ncbi:MAG TPA: FAD-binding protein [Candidatus Binataceae bacterium]
MQLIWLGIDESTAVMVVAQFHAITAVSAGESEQQPMNRRAFLKAIGSAMLLPLSPRPSSAQSSFRRRRPSDSNWPSKAAWNQLNDAVGGNLIPVDFYLSLLKTDQAGSAARQLLKNLKNPYYIGDQPGLTQTLGWVDAWATQPSVYAVAARNASDISAAVNFARENNLRLAIKGGGHSYQGTSNAPDSLLIWTRQMHDIQMHAAFVPQGCQGTRPPQPAVTLGAGTIWMQAYDAVTTKAGRYVQGGGCTTVGVAGLIQSGGFGSFSKHYGTAAGGLLEAEVVTADGQIRIANACTNADLFWALKGGGGGSFGVVSKVTVRTHDLPEFFGIARFTVKAASDDAYRRLIRKFVCFYREHLFNDHWGEQARMRRDNGLEIMMVSWGLDSDQGKEVWRPFLDWVRSSSDDYSLKWPVVIESIPAEHFWDAQWWKSHWPEMVFPRNRNPLHSVLDDVLVHLIREPVFRVDDRPGAGPHNFWWEGDAGQVGWFIWSFQSLWIPQSLLRNEAQQRLADALFAASRFSEVSLHFNKGLAGAPAEAVARAKDTAMNPAVLNAFALAIAADAEQSAYPGIPGHEPSVEIGREAARRIERCMNELRTVTGETGAYVSESDYFQKGFQRAYWGSNYPRLAETKKKYDPDGLFIVHNGVGSEQWSDDGFATKNRRGI